MMYLFRADPSRGLRGNGRESRHDIVIVPGEFFPTLPGTLEVEAAPDNGAGTLSERHAAERSDR